MANTSKVIDKVISGAVYILVSSVISITMKLFADSDMDGIDGMDNTLVQNNDFDTNIDIS